MAGVVACSTTSSCGACKFLRRKCAVEGCVFAPYFSYDQGGIHFAAVHKVFGASNVSKLLSHLPVQHRGEAAVTISYEAQARMRDPVYGCVAHIFALQQQVASLQVEVETLTKQLATISSTDEYRNPISPPRAADAAAAAAWDYCGFQLCMQQRDDSLQYYASNVFDNCSSSNSSSTSFSTSCCEITKVVVQEAAAAALPHAYGDDDQEAMEGLELDTLLFSDLQGNEPIPWEDLPTDMLAAGDLALIW